MAEIRPQKAEIHRTRLTVGGNLINFSGDVTTSTSDLITAKLIFNSVLSTKNTKFMFADTANFYLNNPMNRYEYMKLPLDIIRDEIIQQYNLKNLSHKFLYIWKSKKACIGYPRQETFQKINLSYIWPSLDTSQHPSPQVYVGTKLTPSIFTGSG